jgi:hypothetical protein
MSQFEPDQIRAAALTPRWAALSQLGGVAADLHNFDQFLVREPRLLVPVDVQAMVVRAGTNDTEPMVRLPWRDGQTEPPPLDVHDPGTPRAPGVYLLWSPPAALGRGTFVDDPAAPGDVTRRRLRLPVLPDRWVVVRLAVLSGQRDPTPTGWVVEADTGTVTRLADWPGGAATSVADPVAAGDLTLHAGGASWAQSFDAAQGRFSFYDDLSDLTDSTQTPPNPTQVEGDAVSYLVAGWWSVSANDPLDGVGTDVGYRSRLKDLGWNDPDHPSPDADQRATSERRYSVANTFGLAATQRYTQPLLLDSGKAAAAGQLSGAVSPVAQLLSPTISGFLNEAIAAAALPPAPTRSALLHGRIHGVPLQAAPAPDSRPAPDSLRVVLGSSTPDLAATLSVAGTGLGAADQDARRDAERLLSAFASGDLIRIGQSDVWSDIAEYEHAHGFVSRSGGTEGVDRFVDKAVPTADPGAGFRRTTSGSVAAKAAKGPVVAEAMVLWSAVERPHLTNTFAESPVSRAISQFDGRFNADPPPAAAVVREVPRPAPPFHQPATVVLGVAGGGRVLSAVEREEADGALVCRLSDQTSRGHTGILASAELLTSLGSAAVPDEVLDLARESLAEDPFLSGWRASRAKANGHDGDLAFARFRAESALSHAYYSADSDRLASFVGTDVASSASRQKATEGLLRGSMSDGVWANPEGVTIWGQPWRPLFCDWEVTLQLGPTAGWELTGTDLEYAGAEPLAGPETLSFQGRSPLVAGAAQTIAAGLDRWLTEERQRDIGGHGLADPATEEALAALRDSLTRIDLLSVALDGVREQLLGLSYDRGLLHKDADADLSDGTRQAVVSALPRLLAAGLVTLSTARLVDAFGRCVELPLDQVLVPERLAQSDDGSTEALLYRPRLSAPSRWRFDLVDATSTSVDAALARVDQADLTQQVNPVAGFLLPDHMDESLEVFATDGRPLGELMHDPFSDAVTWEIAPGRTDVAPAAGPTDDPDPTHHRVGWIASGLVAADATVRQGRPSRGETESSLSVLLRAIDTTLWAVDPFGSLGTEHIAGLVGRPIAVVTARLSLDVQPDVAGRVYPDPDTAGLRAGRQAAYDALVEEIFEVRLGEVTRSDDGLLGYFVDDDFSVFRLVDRVVAEEALPSGRCRGLLDPDNPDPMTPDPIDPDHPYVNADGLIRIHPGQTVRLTLLMHPGGKVHLSSGLLPRTSQALARDWVQPGLSTMAPSLRSGPLLIDADKVRLPKVASFPAEQLFTHRDTPATWKDDPILAATQSALLPDTQPEVQEGWIRIAPNPQAAGDGTGPAAG